MAEESRITDGDLRWTQNYRRIIARLRERHPLTGVCERCRRTRATNYVFVAYAKARSLNRADYREMCSTCRRRASETARRDFLTRTGLAS